MHKTHYIFLSKKKIYLQKDCSHFVFYLLKIEFQHASLYRLFKFPFKYDNVFKPCGYYHTKKQKIKFKDVSKRTIQSVYLKLTHAHINKKNAVVALLKHSVDWLLENDRRINETSQFSETTNKIDVASTFLYLSHSFCLSCSFSFY